MKTIPTLFVAAALAIGTAFANAQELARKDKEFLKNAAQGGMTEVRLGTLAKEKATHADVKSFGSMMTTDHGKANAELKALAEKKSVELPTELDAKHQGKLDKFAKLSGDEFDKAYVKEMVSKHKKEVSEFEDASREAKDPEVKAFAEKTLPTLRAHLEQVQAIQKELGK